MSRRTQFFGWLVSVAGVALAAAGCTKPVMPPQETPEVVVVHPVTEDYTEFGVYTGRTSPVDTQNVMARVSGLVKQINFREGAFVHKGDVLFELDPATFQATYDEEAAQVQVRESALELARVTLARDEDSYRRAPGSVSLLQLDQDRANVKVAEAATLAAKATLETARLNLDYTKVRAEVDGVASRAIVTVGNNVQAGGSAGGGTVLTTVVTVDPMYAYFDVDERTVQRVRQLMRQKKFVTDAARKHDPFLAAANAIGLASGGALLPISTASSIDPGFSFAVVPLLLARAIDGDRFPHKGYIDFVDNQVNTATGTLRIRGLFWNHDRVLIPGEFVRVKVPISAPVESLLVPDEAVVTDQGQKVLYVLDKEDKVVYRPVTLGGLDGTMRVIEEGVGPEDRVITEGQLLVRAGMKVRPKAPSK